MTRYTRPEPVPQWVSGPANDNGRQSVLPRSLPPIGLSRETAAAYIDISPSKFDQLVADGRMPRPKKIDGRRVWDRVKIERYFAALPGDEDGSEEQDEWAAYC